VYEYGPNNIEAPTSYLCPQNWIITTTAVQPCFWWFSTLVT